MFPISEQLVPLTAAPSGRFEHRSITGTRPRMESYCLECGSFVAGSESIKVLGMAEKAHICSTKKPSRSSSSAPPKETRENNQD